MASGVLVGVGAVVAAGAAVGVASPPPPRQATSNADATEPATVPRNRRLVQVRMCPSSLDYPALRPFRETVDAD